MISSLAQLKLKADCLSHGQSPVKSRKEKTIMRTVKSFSAGCFLSLLLAIPVLAGDMPGPGKSQVAPSTGSPKLQTASCEQEADGANQMSLDTVCVEATPNPFQEAIIIAIQLLTSVY
jgi:hypothetical protein